MPEERILLEKPSTPVPADELAPQEPDDPFAGPTVNPWRGVRKAAWRLYVFYGVFAFAIVAGLVLVWGAQESWPYAAFVLAWAATYLALNLLSAGLPGPNLVRYNKDLEIVAPLFVLALARVGEWLAARSRWLAILYAGSYGAFGVTRVIASLLIGVSPTDPLSFLSVAAFLTLIAMLASYIPARRAATVDPMEALRCE